MSQVIVFPRGQLSEQDRRSMQEAGIVAVEADDPSKVVTVIAAASVLTPDDFMMSLLAGINAPNQYSSSDVALKTLGARLSAREKKDAAPATKETP